MRKKKRRKRDKRKEGHNRKEGDKRQERDERKEGDEREVENGTCKIEIWRRENRENEGIKSKRIR